QGQNLAAAQADAVTAKEMGAFGDLSMNSVTQPYSQDLASEQVIAFGAVFMPQSWFETYAPYEYSTVPTGTKWSDLWANTICARMAGLPAAFSGNMTSQGRRFGLLVGDAPTYQEDGNELQSQLRAQCGVGVARRVAYTINFADYTQQAVNVIAQMKAAGVTTLVCGCDPIMMGELSNAADQQQYFPEYLTVYWGDPAARLSSSDQWSHALVNGGQSPAAKATESYAAFKRIAPNSEPAEQYFPAPYEDLLQIFAGLQAAGPDLTPATFERGMFSLPPSMAGGDYGDWSFGAGSFTPGVDTRLGWWSPSSTSNYDGMKGAWENCESGRWLHYAATSDYGSPHTQLHCFGK
ncbi:MAG TPA: hypothetical protein VGR90_05660, partial [Acidimicrobiales bacterium]|nr:hypothetical protein [Acidimicrobiales bacterium]